MIHRPIRVFLLSLICTISWAESKVVPLGNTYLFFSAGSKLAALDFGISNHHQRFQTYSGLSTRFDLEGQFQEGIFYFQVAPYVYPYSQDRDLLLLGPEIGVLNGGKKAFGLRADYRKTIGNTLLVGLGADKLWARGFQSNNIFAYAGWRF